MDINLLPHNQMLYNKIVAEMDNGNRSIFYSEGTGLGKSYIFMALVQNKFYGKRVLYIVPKIAIFSNLEHYEEFQSLDATVTYTTFAAFNTYDSDSTLKEDYDVVFVDECHHMLSDIQGSNVYTFLQDMEAQNKFCFGMTATPNYNGEFVDEKYFKVSCYGYDVFEAIEQELLPRIDVALAEVDLSNIPEGTRASYSITGTQITIKEVIEEYSHVTHWLAYFSTKKDLNANVSEMQKLFPEFKILKIYKGISNVNQIIKEFEEYDGKVVLMSVSMLLEGMHLSNVGGILLYRNVIRNSTYFQIYGRLCKLYSKHTPVFVDMTSSVFHIDDFPTFKSSRAEVRKVYNRKDIFDVHSFGYRLVELNELANTFKVKQYRDIQYTTICSLACALHRTRIGVQSWLRKQKRTVEDYIDHTLKDSTYEEYVSDSYIGYYKCYGYKYSNYSDLRKQLHVKLSYSEYLFNHKGASVEQYIRAMLTPKPIIRRFYKGIEITTTTCVAEHLNITDAAISDYLRKNDIDIVEYIDRKLGAYKKIKQTIVKYYRGVNISSMSTVAEYFGITRHAVAYYLNKHNVTIEQYVDLRLDNPEKLQKDRVAYLNKRKETVTP